MFTIYNYIELLLKCRNSNQVQNSNANVVLMLNNLVFIQNIIPKSAVHIYNYVCLLYFIIIKVIPTYVQYLLLVFRSLWVIDLYSFILFIDLKKKTARHKSN